MCVRCVWWCMSVSEQILQLYLEMRGGENHKDMYAQLDQSSTTSPVQARLRCCTISQDGSLVPIQIPKPIEDCGATAPFVRGPRNWIQLGPPAYFRCADDVVASCWAIPSVFGSVFHGRVRQARAAISARCLPSSSVNFLVQRHV